MANSKWYYLCDLENKKAIEYTQIPEVWGNVTGMIDLDDETLADMSWSNNPGKGFLTETKAVELGIDSASMQTVKAVGAAARTIALKTSRDILLAASDAAVTIDRWEKYDEQKKAIIANYRQQLRDLFPNSDVFNFTWPEIPTELDYLKLISIVK